MAQDPLHLLCIEPRFPGRLGAVADWLVRRRGYRCRFFCASAEPPEQWPQSAGKGMDVISFQAGGAARERAVSWVRYLERGLCHAYGCWETLEMRRPRPVDLVLGRSAGLGSTLFVPVYLPGAPIVNYFDYFYHAHEHDLASEAGEDMPVEYFHWRRSANAMDLLDLESGVVPWTSTTWQRDLFPSEYRDDFLVLHEGVDTRRFTPRKQKPHVVAGRPLPADALVITFVARNLDRLRGFDRFTELANRLQRRYPSLLCIVLGGSPSQRGLDFQYFNKDYGAYLLSQKPPHDPQRLWLFSAVTPSTVAEVLAASDLHVYPGRPYPVARSMLEAMASGCVVLATDCEPVREIATHEKSALLVSGDDPDAWERAACAVLDRPADFQPLREAAVQVVQERYAQDVTLPRLAGWFNEIVNRGNQA